MVTPGGALREFADHWTPIFADPRRRYDHAAAVTSHEPAEGGVRLSLRGSEYTLRLPGQSVAIATTLHGRFNVYNALAAAATARHYGVAPHVMRDVLATFPGVPGRFEAVDEGQGFGVVVDYAHTPDALERVLQIAREFTSGRVIALFGCGGDRDRGKRPLMGEAAARLADYVVLTSDNPRSEDPQAILAEIEAGVQKACAGSERHATIPDRREAIRVALTRAEPGDLVVIAGKGHETYQVLRDRTIPFDDRVVAKEALAALGYAPPEGGRPPGGR